MKFPEQPTIEICFSEEEIEGFSHYLEYLNGQADSFTEKTATAWFAADMEDSKLEFKGRKMCGRAHTKGQLKKTALQCGTAHSNLILNITFF